MRERLGARTLSFLAVFLLGAPALAESPLRPGTQGAEVKSPPGTQVEEVRFEPERIEVKPASEGSSEVVVRYPGAQSAPAGAPDLPRVLMWVEVPAGMRVREVRGEPWGEKSLGAVRVQPVATDVQAGEAPPAVVADRRIYDASGAYPEQWAGLGTEGSLRGHEVVGVWVSPVRWEAKSGRLTRAAGVRVTLLLEPGRRGPEPVERRRVVREIEARFEEEAGKVVRGLQPAAAKGAQAGSEAVGSGPAGPGPFQPSFRPSPDGSPVEYVIVTSQALAATFQPLADWKTKKGVQAVVRTVEWIDQNYPNGVDRAERIRFFIRDAYQNWGTLFVLLGGDTDVIPPRYAVTTFYGGETIPADCYYGCLDGNWNAEGDDKFGEAEFGDTDLTDLLFEVSIGRAPVSTVTQADTFVDKLLLYEINAPNDSRYPPSALFMAERLFPTTHGAEIAEQAIAFLPPWFRVVRLYEESASYPGSFELTRESAIDSVNNGFGIVHHVGHGYRNTMAVGAGSLNNADADALVNGPRFSVVFAINCSSTSIDFNSIGERWVKNANGGSIIYIGTSRLSFVSPATIYQNEWYRQVFEDSTTNIGLATDLSRASLGPNSVFDGPYRWNMMATTLLGDPEVDLYTNAVIPIQVTHSLSVPLSPSPVTVTVNAQGVPLAGASVTLWKQGEVYTRATTNGSGQAQLVVGAQTTGPVAVTVHKSYYRVYTGSINVTQTGNPYMFVLSSSVDDDGSGGSAGDGDGLVDAGETIDLTVTLRNGGGSQATGVSATLTANDPENALTIVQDTVSYGTIGAGGASAGASRFRIIIAPDAPVAYQPVLTVNITATQGSWSDVITLPIRRPYLEHYSHVVDDAVPRGNGDGIVQGGEEIWYLVTLRNTGQDRAVNVTGTIQALRASDLQPHPLVTVTDANSSFGTLPPGATAQGDRFAFVLAGNADPSTLLLKLTLNDALGQEDVQFLDVLDPAATDSITAFGSPSVIRLTWRRSESTDSKGYDVFRSLNPGGPFTRINNYTVDGSAIFEDLSLQPLTRYYYRVVTRDSSYNASEPSLVASGTTNPPLAAGWPIEIEQQSSTSPIIADIDGGSQTEILTGGDVQYAWHGDGTEVVNGDDDERTNGPFSLYGRGISTTGFSATPAAGSVDGNSSLEVVNVGFSSESLYVWNNQGQLLNGWPQWVRGDFNWSSPLMADLDNNGDLEIVVWAGNGGRLFAWHHNGQELVDGDNDPSTNGVLARITGTSYNYGCPAVANLDADPQLEILVPVHKSTDNSGGIYAFNINGTPVPGWPFFTGAGNASEVSASIAVADLDHNTSEEVIVACERQGGRVYVLNSNGTIFAGWPKTVTATTLTDRLPSPVVADLDGDGNLDIIYADTGGTLWAWNRQGLNINGFPVNYTQPTTNQRTQSTPVVGDIDGDNQYEILFGDETGKLHAYNNDGTLVAGFPIQTGGEIRGSPAIWDLDRDNLIEVAAVSFDTNVYVWDLPGDFNPTKLPWPFFRHDYRNTGRYSTSNVIGIQEPTAAPALTAAFHPVRPNPFNPRATFDFDVPGEAGGARPVRLEVYDVNGRLVRRLIDAPVGTGRQSMIWDGRGQDGRRQPSGVYFARIEIGAFNATQKITMLR